MNKTTIKRLISYVMKFKLQIVAVLVSIIISSLAGVASSLFLGTLIDDYISPLLIESTPV